jgi:hypothetical protein
MVAGTIRGLCSGKLPGAEDFVTLVPPTSASWVRRVPGANLWLLFTYDARHVFIGTYSTPRPCRRAERRDKVAGVTLRLAHRAGLGRDDLEDDLVRGVQTEVQTSTESLSYSGKPLGARSTEKRSSYRRRDSNPHALTDGGF